MRFHFASAADLFSSQTHPRLIWASHERDHVLHTIRQSDVAPALDILLSLARQDAQTILDPAAAQSLFQHAITHEALPVNLERLAVAAWLAPEDPHLTQAAIALTLWVVSTSTGPSARPYIDTGHHGMALAYDLLHPHFSETQRLSLRHWLLQYGVLATIDKIKSYFLRAPGSNIALVGVFQALVNLLAIDSDESQTDLSPLRHTLVQYLDSGFQATTGPQGYPAEDIGYGTAIAARMFLVACLAQRAGWFHLADTCPHFYTFGRAMLHFVQPWGQYLTNTGDHGDDFAQREFILPILASHTKDPSLLWLMGTIFYPPFKHQWPGRSKAFPETTLPDARNLPVSWMTLAAAEYLAKPVHPSNMDIPTQYMDESRGVVSFRSSWSPDATYLCFDSARRPTTAMGHEHDSAGHFTLSAFGEYFGISPGRYNMDQTCHSVVLVEGKTGHSIDGHWRATYHHGQLTGYHPSPFVDSASSDNSQQSNCYWSYRTIALVKGQGAPAYAWTFDDVNADHGVIMPRDYWWTLHTCPGNTILTHQHAATITGALHGNRLEVFFATPDASTLPAPYNLRVQQDQVTPSSHRYLGPDRITQERKSYAQEPWDQIHGPVFFRPRLIANLSGPNGRILSLMVPTLKHAPAPRFTRLPNLDAQVGVQIDFGPVTDTILCAYGHKQLISGDIDARGNWLVLRRNSSTGQVLNHTLMGGSYLKVAGKRIPTP